MQPVAAVADGSLTAGHWSSLALLEISAAISETLATYEQTTGHPVYLRPTDAGLTVSALDPTLLAMIGVGGRAPGACTTEETVKLHEAKHQATSLLLATLRKLISEDIIEMKLRAASRAD